MLHFSESMDSASLIALSQYSASHGLLHPSRINPDGPLYQAVSLTFDQVLQSGITYTVTLMATPQDCAGNPLDRNARSGFALSHLAESLDVVLNEVLFDTPAGMSEFIELYNRSDEVFDLAQFTVALYNQEFDSMIRQVPLKTNPFLLFPDHVVALTRDADHLPDFRNTLDQAHIAEYPALFTLPDKEGEIALLGHSGQIIDDFRYSQHMHSAFISVTEGISLERIRADIPASEYENWHSAASAAGYATPGHANSQALTSDTESDRITLAPAVFSPDGDGRDDAAVLTIIPGDAGFLANIRIYDARGNMIRTLASGYLLGTETVMSWDGSRNDRACAEIGPYVVFVELFNQKGIVKKYKKVITLAKKH
jgi:hypothetical protein